MEVIVIGSGGDFGALDPYFFHRFLATTPEWEELARALPQPFQDTARAFDILEAHGALVQTIPPDCRSARLFIAPHLR